MEWDDLCWNPHQESVQRGEISGSEAGRLAGFRDGKALGQVKGFELGMEIGFIRGFLEALEQDNFATVVKNERIQRSIDQLHKVLEEELVGPDAIFQENHNQLSAKEAKEALPPHQSDDADSPPPPPSDDEDKSKVDVESKLQRIRARFKVLIVQLKLPKSSLKDYMDEAAKSSSISNDQEPAFEGEW
ncbi:unnamed protein product [Cylindrotheca closterium]|uniref:Essential protein Yae1 N-terminal domain-containing protein n=1 Tax=Cylindrotheca closterium TaxID=2856 RepID=A0AAD2CK96_9STRA|nr:unnamed protein product [Cylindrotheca closterium]